MTDWISEEQCINQEVSFVMQQKLARIISIIFHPLIMPAIGMLIIFNTGSYLSFMPFEGKRLIMLIVVTGTILFPLSIIPFFLYYKWVGKAEMTNYRERILPLLFTVIMYYLTYYMLHRIPVPVLIQTFMLGASSSVFLNLVINLKWKISSHMIGIGGITGLIVALYINLQIDVSLFLVLSILLSGVIGFSRLYLNAHTPLQVYLGYLTGFLTIFLVVVFK